MSILLLNVVKDCFAWFINITAITSKHPLTVKYMQLPWLRVTHSPQAWITVHIYKNIPNSKDGKVKSQNRAQLRLFYFPRFISTLNNTVSQEIEGSDTLPWIWVCTRCYSEQPGKSQRTEAHSWPCLCACTWQCHGAEQRINRSGTQIDPTPRCTIDTRNHDELAAVVLLEQRDTVRYSHLRPNTPFTLLTSPAGHTTTERNYELPVDGGLHALITPRLVTSSVNQDHHKQSGYNLCMRRDYNHSTTACSITLTWRIQLVAFRPVNLVEQWQQGYTTEQSAGG